MKRMVLISVLSWIVLSLATIRSFAEDITVTTYYPAPFGSYNTLQVFPNSAPPITCDDQHVGFMYFRQDPDPSLSELLVCKGAAQGWKTVASGGASAYWTNTATTVHLVDSNNNVAIGDTDSQGKKLRLRVSTGNTSGETITTESYIHGHPTADASTAIYKSFLGYNWRDPTDSAQTIGELTGVNGFVDINGPGTSTNNIGLLGGVRINSGVAATATYASGVAGQILASGGTFGSAAAIRALSPQTGGTINNLYGVYIDNQDVIGTNRYALYYNGASKVVITANGRMGIGTDTPGTNTNLQVEGDARVDGNVIFNGQKICKCIDCTGVSPCAIVYLTSTIVPGSFNKEQCSAFCSDYIGITPAIDCFYELGCLFVNGTSKGVVRSCGGYTVPLIPSPNCGWQ